MLDPATASVVYTPMALKHQQHSTLGRVMILPTADVATALDPEPTPGDHIVVARPPQRAVYAEAIPVVPDGEADPVRAMLAAFARLVLLDGLDPGVVGAMFAAHLTGWSEAVADGRIRQAYRVSR